MIELILLDNQSTCNIMANRRLLTNIRFSENNLMLNTQTGSKCINQVGDLKNVGTVWYMPEGWTNILSFSFMRALVGPSNIGYNAVGDYFWLITIDRALCVFNKTPKGLYAYNPGKNNEGKAFVASQEELSRYYSKRQFERANKARHLLHSAGHPSVKDLKLLLETGQIEDCPVKAKDLIEAELIMGPDVAQLKGKGMRPKSIPAVSDQVAVPKELYELHKNVEMCIDTMHVCGLTFLCAIVKNIQYRTCFAVPTRGKVSTRFYKALDRTLRILNKGGFAVVMIHADGEFKPLFDDIADDFRIELNYYSAEEHVPEIERAIRTNKEQV